LQNFFNISNLLKKLILHISEVKNKMALAKYWYNYLKSSEIETDGVIKKVKGFLEDYPLSVLKDKLIVCRTPNPEVHLFNAYESYLHFIMAYQNIPMEERHFYEIIVGSWEQKPHFDLDFKTENGLFNTLRPDGSPVSYTSNQILEILIDAIEKVLDEQHITINLETDVLIYSSCLGEKNSYHLILNNWYHRNNENAKGFYQAVISKIPTELNNNKLIDGSVYSTTQQFRILGSTKVGTYRPKILIDKFCYKGKTIEHKYPKLDEISKDEKDKQIYVSMFEESLITQTYNCNALPNFAQEKEKIQYTNNTYYQVTPEIANFSLDKLLGKENYKISKIKDGLIILQRIRPSQCGICKRVHENENPYLQISPTGNINYFCRRSEENLCIGILPAELLSKLLKPSNVSNIIGLGTCENSKTLQVYEFSNVANLDIWEKNINLLADNFKMNTFQKPTIENVNKACENGHLDLLITLSKKCKPTKHSMNLACKNGHLKIIKHLHTLGITPTINLITDHSIESIIEDDDNEEYIDDIELIIENNYTEILQFFIEAGIKLNIVYLNMSAKYNSFEILKLLINSGIQPNLATLNCAVEGRSIPIIKYLLDLGLKPRPYTLDVGIATQNLEIIKILVDTKVRIADESILKTKNVKIIEFLKSQKIDQKEIKN
jgi:hypothetical protein